MSRVCLPRLVRRVAFQGAPGAYSEEAVTVACGPGVEALGLRENGDVTRAVARGEVELGVLPIENSIVGSVLASYDAILAEPAVRAIGEVEISIRHCVLGVSGAELGWLRSIESHPVALAQCAAFLARHPAIVAHPAYDTAGAAREVARARDLRRGAIASARAAERYGLAVLASGVEDRPDNRTRFLLLGNQPAELEEAMPARTLLILGGPRCAAELAHVARVLEHRTGISRIEGRAIDAAESACLLEIDHLAGVRAASEAERTARRVGLSVRVIGPYSVARPARAAPIRGTGETDG